MERNGGARSGHQTAAARFRQKIDVLERKAAERRDRTSDSVQLRAETCEVIHELKRDDRPVPGRKKLIKRAHAVLRALPEQTRSSGAGRARSTPARARVPLSGIGRSESIRRKLHEIESEIEKLLSGRNRLLRLGHAIAPAMVKREAALFTRLASVQQDVQRCVGVPQEREAMLEQVQRLRARLKKRPKPKGSRPKRAEVSAKAERERRARLREVLEEERRERRDASSSVYTISGGLPGLGKRQ